MRLSSTPARPFHLFRLTCTATLLLALSAVPAAAAGPDDVPMTPLAIAALELEAANAQPREQCFLYTEVLHSLTELAGQQMRSGDDTDASLTLGRVDAVAHKLGEAVALNARRLKNAEQLLEHTDRRLSDMARVASGQTHDAMQAALADVTRVHSQLLAMVFAH